MANQGDNCRYYIRIYIGGVHLFYTRLAAEHSSSIEWLPRWGQSIWLCLNGCLGGGSCLGGLPRWGRGYLCMYSLRQSDTLNSLRQYDTMIFFLYVFFWLSYFTKSFLYI